MSITHKNLIKNKTSCREKLFNVTKTNIETGTYSTTSTKIRERMSGGCIRRPLSPLIALITSAWGQGVEKTLPHGTRDMRGTSRIPAQHSAASAAHSSRAIFFFAFLSSLGLPSTNDRDVYVLRMQDSLGFHKPNNKTKKRTTKTLYQSI